MKSYGNYVQFRELRANQYELLNDKISKAHLNFGYNRSLNHIKNVSQITGPIILVAFSNLYSISFKRTSPHHTQQGLPTS